VQGDGLNDVVAAEGQVLPDDVSAAPSMLSYDERALLHWAARTGRPRGGQIVDAGCFLGGSSVSPARGLRARGEGAAGRVRVHAYDRFAFGTETERHWVPEGMPFGVGASTLPAFERTVAAVRDLIEVHLGDVREVRWPDEPISVLFVDIAKSWDTADHVMHTFAPALVPGESVVIQQDQVHWGHPWCAIAMELLADRFELLGWVWFSSAVYRCKGRVTADALPESLLRDVALEEKLVLLQRFADRIGWPIGASVLLSGAVALGSHEEWACARERVAELEAEVGDDQVPYLSEGYATLRAWLDQLEAGQAHI
jgi:hypothetical protein